MNRRSRPRLVLIGAIITHLRAHSFGLAVVFLLLVVVAVFASGLVVNSETFGCGRKVGVAP
jgi:hypothetical protein